MHKQLTSLAQKEMTRKEFMLTVGFGLASILGFGSLIKLMHGDASVLLPHHASAPVQRGYGGGKYGV